MKEFMAYEAEARQKQYGLWNESLSDGRVANIVKQYSQLSPEGKKRFDDMVKNLLKQYPLEGLHK
jgi:hypothetical protein